MTCQSTEHTCSCGQPATHKVGEELAQPGAHNLTAYVCCVCFRRLMGPAAPCVIDGESYGVWRDPPEESIGLYPGIVVSDERQFGSLTFGRSRLPIRAVFPARWPRWDEYRTRPEPARRNAPHHGVSQYQLSRFFEQLANHRGEFARLLAVLANVERLDAERPETETEGEDAADFWWGVPEWRATVLGQLYRCCRVLESMAQADAAAWPGAEHSGYYGLPSGSVVHLQTGEEPTPEFLAAMDELTQAAVRRLRTERMTPIRDVLAALARRYGWEGGDT